jgi:hypothetical protein
MKFLFLILALLVSLNCTNQTSADKLKNDTAQSTPTIDTANVSNTNQWTPPPDEPVDNVKLGKLDKQNAVFEIVPEEFNGIDFGNFKYSSSREKKIIPLKNGSHQYEYKGGGCKACGGETYDLNNVYFLDLTGDAKKEAVVLLSVLSCGGSCDGGATFIYIYSADYNEPKLLWRLETGSRAYGCSIKSLAIESKKINVELFGRCYTGKDADPNSFGIMNKFNIKDSTHLVYEFSGKTFIRKLKEYISVPERNVMNYRSEINIIE